MRDFARAMLHSRPSAFRLRPSTKVSLERCGFVANVPSGSRFVTSCAELPHIHCAASTPGTPSAKGHSRRRHERIR